MEELNEEQILALGDEYAESRMQYFKPWEGSYKLACKNAFVNAYVAGYFAKCKEIDPNFVIPEYNREPQKPDYEQIEG